MYTVTIDLASPTQDPTLVRAAADAVGAELEQLVLRLGPGALRRLETMVSPVGAIVAVTVVAASPERAREDACSLVLRALSESRFASWPVVSSDVHPATTH